MNIYKKICIFSLTLVIVSCGKDDEEVIVPNNPVTVTPPFYGSIYVDPNIITDADYTTFTSLSYAGQDSRTMFDRRVNDWITVNAFLFNATFDDGLYIEIQVNPEFENADAAEIEAVKYATVIGRLPTVLRKDVETVSIHKGTELFGGGNKNLLIHTGQAILYENDGILEETFIHESSHTSLDAEHSASSGWIAAQESDGNFITEYAYENPVREDIAESFVLYMAIRYRSSRITDSIENTILETMPNRIFYFDDQTFNMYPID